MRYSFRTKLYDSMDDVLNDVHANDYLYEQYVREALRGYAPFQILTAIEYGDPEFATEIYVDADDLILQEIEEVKE